MSRDFKVSILGIILLLVGPMLFLSFPESNCTKDEINIETGHGRHSRYILFIRTSKETYDTVISKVLKKPVEGTGNEAWRLVNRFSPPSFKVSPHYRFHGALNQAKELEMIFEINSVPPEKQAEIAVSVLRAWQASGGDYEAKELIRALMEQ